MKFIFILLITLTTYMHAQDPMPMHRDSPCEFESAPQTSAIDYIKKVGIVPAVGVALTTQAFILWLLKTIIIRPSVGLSLVNLLAIAGAAGFLAWKIGGATEMYEESTDTFVKIPQEKQLLTGFWMMFMLGLIVGPALNGFAVKKAWDAAVDYCASNRLVQLITGT